MSNGKDVIIHLIVGLTKKTLYKMGQYFPKPYRSLVETLMLRLICLIMQQNPILKNAAGTDTSSLKLK